MAKPKKPSLVEQALSAPIPSEVEAERPLGVPKGFRPQPTEGLPPGWQPYHEEDVWMPGSLPREQVMALQAEMANAGLIDEYVAGSWDPDTRKGYRTLLEMANASGRTWDAELKVYAGAKKDEKGRERAPLVVKLTNPMDLRKAFEKGTRAAIGRKLDDRHLERMVVAYQTLESQEQRAQYQAAGGVGGTVTEAPSPDVFAAEQTERMAPLEASGVDMRDAFEGLMQAISGRVRASGFEAPGGAVGL